jgi:transposase-like protein
LSHTNDHRLVIEPSRGGEASVYFTGSTGPKSHPDGRILHLLHGEDAICSIESRSYKPKEGFVTPAVACWMQVRAVAEGMRKISYAGYRFPPEVIHQAIWLYLRFTLSFRDVEDLLAERGIAVSYETVRRWVNHFGPMIAAHLRKRRPKPHATWHLDEVYLKIDGRMVYLWRAVDAEGEVLDVLVQSKRNKHAALKLMRKLLKKYAFAPERLVTDDLRSYAPAARDRHRAPA